MTITPPIERVSDHYEYDWNGFHVKLIYNVATDQLEQYLLKNNIIEDIKIINTWESNAWLQRLGIMPKKYTSFNKLSDGGFSIYQHNLNWRDYFYKNKPLVWELDKNFKPTNLKEYS